LPADASRFEEKIKSLALGDRQSRRNISDIATFMVYIPPLGSKEAADKKAGELRNHSVTDFFIIQDQSAMRWGISLGVFKTEEAARAHLANLNTKGVKTARIGPRTVSTEKFSYQLRTLTAIEKKNFDSIKANFTGQEVRECAAAVNPAN